MALSIIDNGKLSRMTGWWRPKAGAIFSLLLFYLALWDVPFWVACQLLGHSLITLTGFGLVGYVLNDWADIPYDRKVGKTNLLSGIPLVGRVFLLLGLLVVTLVPWFVYFKTDEWSVALIAIQFALQLAYPMPPVRLKNYPLAAMFNDALYAFVVPGLLAWHTFDLTAGLNDNDGQVIHFVFLSIWMLAMGVRHIINHHVEDRENDRLAGTANMALKVSPLRLRKWVQWAIFPIELHAALLFFAVLLWHSGLLPFVFIWVLVVLGAMSVHAKFPLFQVSFTKNRLDDFTSFYFGLISLGILVLDDTRFGWILVLFLLQFSYWFQQAGWGLLLMIRAACWTWPKEQLSLAFNWSIYYFRKWILDWSEERNWGEHYPKRLLDLDAERRSRNGVLAVFNQNFSKYSETFISGQIGALDYLVHYYSGWPRPLHLDGEGDLIRSGNVLTKLKYALMNLFNENVIEYEEKVIAESLIERNVSVMVAHFGPMGTALLRVAQITGIPLVVVFHGYDAWNRKELSIYEDAYRELFKKASAVVGVSKQICGQLESLGFPPDKITYLPAFVNPVFFNTPVEYTDRPDFLSVGRFSCTKSPFLVLLAFEQVLKELPEAKLRMIGGDDGEGLFEASQVMARALGIEKQVEFLGVLSPEQVLEEMKRTSIFVQHSVTTPVRGDREGTPVSIMETMALGLPIVATDHAGIGELIENGTTGILVQEYDHIGMAKEMLRLAQNRDLRKQLGTNAAKAIRQNPVVANGLNKFSELIQKHITE